MRARITALMSLRLRDNVQAKCTELVVIRETSLYPRTTLFGKIAMLEA